jgi:hypothetical protein
MSHKNIPHTEKHKVWMTNKTFRKHKSTRFGWLTKTFRKHAKKNKGYMQLHKIRQCCKQFSWPNSRQYCNSVQNFDFDTKTLRKLTINVEKNFQKFGCSRSFTIFELQDKVNYSFLEGVKFPKRWPYFLGNMSLGGQIS